MSARKLLLVLGVVAVGVLTEIGSDPGMFYSMPSIINTLGDLLP